MLDVGRNSMDRYPPIAEHGLIGDLQTAALVTTNGCVDWFCCPRLDAPSVFASLLDHDNGGRFRIGPEGEDYVARQLYFPDTAILVTRFMTPDGVGEVLDFMPIEDPHLSATATGWSGWCAVSAARSGSRWSASRGSTTAARPMSWSSPTRGRCSAPRRCS
jgi:GH15 family glucan-1,4-alpha-glucosidase